jgi:hypothetical protein
VIVADRFMHNDGSWHDRCALTTIQLHQMHRQQEFSVLSSTSSKGYHRLQRDFFAIRSPA